MAHITLGTTAASCLRSAEFSDRRWNGHMHRLKDFSTDPFGLTADREAFAVLFDLNLFQRFEVLLDIGPFKPVLVFSQTLIELLSKHQGKKAAKHMAGDIRIVLMIDGSSP